jgi:hypothetical protein
MKRAVTIGIAAGTACATFALASSQPAIMRVLLTVGTPVAFFSGILVGWIARTETGWREPEPEQVPLSDPRHDQIVRARAELFLSSVECAVKGWHERDDTERWS